MLGLMISYFRRVANMRSTVLTLAFMSLATPAMASTCEESFQKKGNFFNGSAFAAQVQLEGGSIEKVFSQLRPILAKDGIKTISADVSTGILKAENPATMFQRALPIDVFASVNGTLLNVEMVFTLPSGVTARSETVKSHMCNALNQLLPKDNAAIVPPVQDKSAAVDIDAALLSKQVKESSDNPARLRLNFVGKTFRVNGKVLSISESDNSYLVSFEGNQPAVNKASADKTNQMTVLCRMAKNQDTAVAALQTNARATLVGRFQGFDSNMNAVQLQECIGG